MEVFCSKKFPLCLLLILIFIASVVLCYSFNINFLKEETFKILFPLILIFIFLISYKLLWLRDRKCHKTEKYIVKNPLLPIESYKDLDEISQTFYHLKTKEIKNIIDDKSKDNATIGILGRWGTGKSSILKILKEELKKEKEKYKVLYLDLISFYSSEQLYFNLIKALGLEFNYPYWKNLFLNYEIGLSSSGFDFKFLIDDPINFEERLNHFKEYITKSLGGRKFILILDELDRLTDQQAILNVFKFINAFGRIRNLYLIAPIDRTAFLNIFKEEYLVAGYLDKTFDFKIEVHLPIDLLKDIFYKGINNIFLHNE
jgi:energy-coupling factor transporter ATP-binding protein EcfA2